MRSQCGRRQRRDVGAALITADRSLQCGFRRLGNVDRMRGTLAPSLAPADVDNRDADRCSLDQAGRGVADEHRAGQTADPLEQPDEEMAGQVR